MADVQDGINEGPGVDSTALEALSSGDATKDIVTKAPAALLIVLGEVHSPEEKDLALQRVVDGLSSFDSVKSGCDLEQELAKLLKQPPKEATDPDETIFEYRSDLLHADILVNPRLEVVQNTLSSFLVTNHSYRFLLYSGLTLQNSGGWFLRDGYFGFSSFSEVFHKTNVVQALSAESGSQLDISVVSEIGEWTSAGAAKLTSRLTVRLNPPKIDREPDHLSAFSSFLSTFISTPSSADLLASTKTFGNFSQVAPTLHIFPGGHGSSALFSLNGVNLLFDGGYSRRSCFWDLVRHLPSLDAVVLSHFGPDNLFGFGSFLEKKVAEKGYPEIGAVFLNTPKTKGLSAAEKTPSLLVNLPQKAAQVFDNLHQISAVVMPCLGSTQNQTLLPIPLYHKVGHGFADLYVLNPLTDNKEAKDLVSNWAKNLSGHKGGIPVLDYVSLCSLLVWKPVSATAKPVRILFPGNTPQAKIFEGLDRLKSVGLFQNVSGVVEKAAGVTKQTTSGVKVAAGVKAKPPTGIKIESKEGGKPTVDPKGNSEHNKDVKKIGDHPKEAKKLGTVETKDAKKPLADSKNGKAPSAVKKDAAAKNSPAKITKKPDGENGAKKPKQQPAAAAVEGVKTEVTKENEKKDTDETSAFPPEAEIAEPVDLLSAAVGDLSLVQALPTPDLRADELEAEKGTLEEEEQEDSGTNKGSPIASELKDSEPREINEEFNPAKEWGVPEGLPAPVNGKEPAAAKKVNHNASLANNTSKKVGDVTKAADASKTAAKRPATAPERLNNTVREGAEKDEKTAVNQSLSRGRPSIAGVSSARGDTKKQPAKPVIPFYVDVAYIPAQGNPSHFDIDFFRRVRARHYVLSAVAPNLKVLALLLEGKQTWDDPSAEVTVIPTYASDALIAWIGENQEQLRKLNVNVTPPASKCTMQLQDTTCAAYRLEF